MAEWRVVSERPLYNDEWLDIRMADVELPDGRHLAHRSIRTPPGAGVLAIDSDRQVLLIWRHRFITGAWGWEIPMGKIEEDESAADAAAREFEEETGWRAGPLRPLIRVQPTPGLTNSEHHVYRAGGATHIGEPVDGLALRAQRGITANWRGGQPPYRTRQAENWPRRPVDSGRGRSSG